MNGVQELTRPPRLGPLYRAAALRRGSAATPALPDRELRLRGVTVDRRHLSEYDRVCGFRLRDELPATYPHVLAFPLAMALMTDPGFPFPLLGLVHVENRIQVLRPLLSTDTFSVSVRAESLRPHDRGTQLDVVATATIDDEIVWAGRSTYLRRTAKGSSDRTAKDSTAKDSEPPRPNATWRIPRRTGTDYAAVSGDRNPIHTSRLLAKAFGFPRTIAHGMWTKARCLAALEGRLPDAYDVRVAFKLPILLPATVGFSATTDGDGWAIGVHDRRTGKPHLSGTVDTAGGRS
jgi:acyl dehydratase